MSNSNNRRRTQAVYVAVSAVAALLISVAGAAVNLADEQSKAAPSLEKPLPKSSLRCWQYGRLIFEEGWLEMPAETAFRAMILPNFAQPGVPVQLLESNV